MKTLILRSILFLLCGMLPVQVVAGPEKMSAPSSFEFMTTKDPGKKISVLFSVPDFTELKDKIPQHVISIVTAAVLTGYTIVHYKKVAAELKVQCAKESAAQEKYGFSSSPTKKQILKKMLSNWRYNAALLVGLGIIGAEQYSGLKNLIKENLFSKKDPKEDAITPLPIDPAHELPEASAPPAPDYFSSNLYPNIYDATPSAPPMPEAEWTESTRAYVFNQDLYEATQRSLVDQ